MLSPLPAQPHNLMGGGGWSGGGMTPLNLPQLGLGLTPTPGSIPCLPLVSPGSTPALGLAGLGLGGLSGGSPGKALEQVHVATDPLRWVHQGAAGPVGACAGWLSAGRPLWRNCLQWTGAPQAELPWI